MSAPTAEDAARGVRVLLAIACAWLVLAIFPFARDVTLLKVVGFQALVLAGAWRVWRGIGRGAPWAMPRPLAWGAIGLMALLAASATLATNPGHAWGEWARLAPGVGAFFLAAYAVRRPEHLAGILGATVGALSVASLYGMVQRLGLDPFPWGAYTALEVDLLRRAPATFANPNLAAHALVLGIPLAALLWARGSRWAGLSLALFAVHLVLTGTRGAMLGLAVAGAVAAGALVYGRIRPGDAGGMVRAAVIVPLVLLAVAIGGFLVVHRASTGVATPSDTTLMLRLHATHGAASMIQERPWLGHGPGHFVIENPPHWSALEQRHYAEVGRRNARVHNEPIEMAVQGGLLAGALYLALLALGIAHALRLAADAGDAQHRRMGLALAAAIAGFAVDGMFGFNLHAPASGGLLWVLLGACAGIATENGQAPVPIATRRSRQAWGGMTVAAGLSLALGATGLGASMLALRGDGAQTFGESDAAYTQYLRAQRLNPWDWRIEQSMGRLMLGEEFHATAARHFEEALRLYPHDPASWMGLARAQTLLAASLAGEGLEGVSDALRTAQAAADRAAALCPPCADGAMAQAMAANAAAVLAEDPGEARAQAQRAEHAAREAIALGTEAPGRAWQIVASARALQGDPVAAGEALAHSLTHAPWDAQTWNAWEELAAAHRLARPYLDSVRWREERLRLAEPESVNERAALAARRARGIVAGFEEAAPHVHAAYAQAAALDPLAAGLWPAYVAFVEDGADPGSLRAALTQAAEALPEAPGMGPVAVQIAALAARDAEGVAVAAENLYRAVELELAQRDARAVQTAFAWVWAYAAQEAQALPRSPARGLALMRLGTTARLLGDDRSAIPLLQEALASLDRGGRAEALRQMSDAAFQLGDDARGLSALEMAARIVPEDFTTQLTYARTLAALGDHAAARAVYGRMLEGFALDAENRARLESEMRDLPNQ